MTNNDFIYISITGDIDSEEQAKLKEINAVISKSHSLIGGETLSEIVVVSSPVFLGILKDFVLGVLNSKRKVNIKTKEFEIYGISEREAKEIIDYLIKN